MENKEQNRDVRTLLFGKFAPASRNCSITDHDVLYQQIRAAAEVGRGSPHTGPVHTFLTFGGYDAICVYSPELNNRDGNWLYDIYKDKERIIQMPTNHVIYHQMHVVSEHPDTHRFWESQSDDRYPFFLATLIYGVNITSLDEEKKKLEQQLGDAEKPLSWGNSKYEQMIRIHMEKLRPNWNDEIIYAIYNGITVADVVVLWRAKNLENVLHSLTHIEYSGIARKTLTTLGFPTDETGYVRQSVINELIRNMDQSITVSIQGSVRDYKKCIDIKNTLTNTLPGSTTANLRTGTEKLAVMLDSLREDIAEPLRRLNRELAEMTAGEPKRFQADLLEKVQFLYDESDRLGDQLPKVIKAHITTMKKDAYSQSRNTADRVMDEVNRLIDRAYSDFNAADKLYNALHPSDTKFYMTNIVKYIRNLNDPDKFNASLNDLIPKIYAQLCCGMYKHQWMQSLGKSDFSITAKINYANLANLLELYRTHHRELYDACWEFLTDVKTNPPGTTSNDYNWIRPSQYATDVIYQLYDDYQQLIAQKNDGKKPESLDLRQFSWFNALQELLGTHRYIDHHPVLHGPSYLVYTSLKIAYAYFSGQVPDYESVEQRKKLLKRSEENIINFIRNLDQLTEQISRNDDAMLNNRSNTHTIHLSLPESALEFYHAFLRRIVNRLIQFDKKANMLPEGFEYDFLLSPKICSSFRFRPMFRTEHTDHSYQAGKVWPQKQAYILELPLESIFNPIDIFIPFVHECFHCFGDILRQRPLRKEYMSLFVASNFLYVTRMSRPAYSTFCGLIARALYSSDQINVDPYLTTSLQQLVHTSEILLKQNTLDALIERFVECLLEERKAKESSTSPFTEGDKENLRKKIREKVKEDTLLLWLAEKGKLETYDQLSSSATGRLTVADAILKNCQLYFKECYADAMTISLLRLSPNEYLACYRKELCRDLYKYSPLEPINEATQRLSNQRTHLAQRFAIVLVACCKMHTENPEASLGSFTEENCYNAINGFTAPDYASDDEIYIYKEFSDTLLQNFRSLINPTMPMPKIPSLHPPTTLNYVVDYLMASIQMLYNTQKCVDASYPNTKMDLANEFDTVIRRGNMFGEDFFRLIYNHHDEIRRSIKQQIRKKHN